jgi:DNA repair protein RAD57
MIRMIQLDELTEPLDDIFSTGDTTLDQALGGGIRTGMLWEIVGER